MRLGLETTHQLVPFHCWISVRKALVVLSSSVPTAQMSVAETMATPLSVLVSVLGFGLATTLQLVPFQCSMSDALVPVSPTAHTSAVETAATARRVPLPGLETTLQLVPSQCRVSVTKRLGLGSNIPTAQMSVTETAVTPSSRLNCVPTLGLTLGLGTTLHFLPVHCSMRVCSTPLAFMKLPTAQTSLVETAVT